MRVFNPFLLCHAADTGGVPVALYGCPIWCPDAIDREGPGTGNIALDELHNLLMRKVLWLPKSTPRAVMMAELGRVPMGAKCIELIVKFWNKVAKEEGAEITRSVFLENMAIPDGWGSSLNSLLRRATGEEVEMVNEQSGLAELDIPAIMDKALKRGLPHLWGEAVHIHGEVRGVPDTCRNGFKRYKYLAWFGGPRLDIHRPLKTVKDMPVNTCIALSHVRVVAKFRCGMHWLATEKTRSVPDPESGRSRVVDRSARRCRCCDNNDREDELHLVVCPAYEVLRVRFPQVFGISAFRTLHEAWKNGAPALDTLFKTFVTQHSEAFWYHMACYLEHSRHIRDSILATP
jgi:hypothetical protein